MAKQNDINPWLFLCIVIIVIAGALAYIDLKSDIVEMEQGVLQQVFE